MYKDFNNYDILLDGRIWSKKRNKFLKPATRKNGYQQVGLVDEKGKQHFEMLHKVIYFAVNGLWEYPEGYELNHIDEDKTNNHISNLELVTHKENINWGKHNSRVAKALKGKIPLANPPKRVGAFKDGVLQMAFPSTREAERQGFSQGNVWACCNGKLKTHKGFTWKYLDE